METDLKTDSFVIQYDPSKITPAEMLKEIEGTGFKGVALEGGIATRSKNFTPAAIDVERLPAKCRVAFDEAGKQKKLVILDVHGPG